MFGDGMKARRKHLQLSQVELADQCNVPQSTISAVENGTRKPTEDTMVMIAKGLGTTVGALLGEVSNSVSFDISIAERQLLDDFRALSREHQADALEHIEYLLYRQSQEKKTTAM